MSSGNRNRPGSRPLPEGSSLQSRNITVAGRRTSIRLEPELWEYLQDIAAREGLSIHDVCTLIDARTHRRGSMTSAIRTFITAYFRRAATEEGHRRAGHGRGRLFPDPDPNGIDERFLEEPGETLIFMRTP